MIHFKLLVVLHLLVAESSVLPTDESPSNICNSCCQGFASLPGVPGAAGIPGSSGHHGLPGRDGLKGEIGFKGDMGERGERGEAGLTGPQGSSGNRGEHGLQGLQGAPGKLGPRGHRGMPGLNGNPSVEGVKGEKGEMGVGPVLEPITGPITRQRSAFSVAKTSSQTGNTNDVLTFDIAHTNIGDDFSLSDNKFTCQINGTYVFMLTINAWVATQNPVIELTKNSVGISQATVWGHTGNTWLQGSQSAVLQLADGDEVWLRFSYHSGKQVYSDANKQTTFSGFLL